LDACVKDDENSRVACGTFAGWEGGEEKREALGKILASASLHPQMRPRACESEDVVKHVTASH